jgi:hypothetical protein
MIIQQAIKVHTSIIDSACDTIVLFILRANILKLRFRYRRKMVRDKILKAYQARSEDENKGLNKYQGGDEYQG